MEGIPAAPPWEISAHNRSYRERTGQCLLSSTLRVIRFVASCPEIVLPRPVSLCEIHALEPHGLLYFGRLRNCVWCRQARRPAPGQSRPRKWIVWDRHHRHGSDVRTQGNPRLYRRAAAGSAAGAIPLPDSPLPMPCTAVGRTDPRRTQTVNTIMMSAPGPSKTVFLGRRFSRILTGFEFLLVARAIFGGLVSGRVATRATRGPPPRRQPAQDFFVSPQGDDHWSGALPEPNPQRTDGPLGHRRVRTGRRSAASRRASNSIGPCGYLFRGGTYRRVAAAGAGPAGCGHGPQSDDL